MSQFKVVIPSQNPSNLRACITALLKAEPQLTRERIIVVDDGNLIANESTMELPVTFVLGAKPFIFARNVNIGLRAANADCIILNDDATLQTPNGFTQMVQQSKLHPYYGIISAAHIQSVNKAMVKQTDHTLREYPDEGYWACLLGYVCVLIPKHVQDLVGELDERFDGYGREDVDYTRRCRLAGLRIAVYDGAVIQHLILPSTYRDIQPNINYLAMADHNDKLYDKKWNKYKEPTRDIMQSLWVGKAIGPLEQLSIRSFLAHGHPFHLYTYEHVEGVPNEVVVKDANEILPQAVIQEFRVIQQFADWFRYNLLYQRGGWWVDVDTVCLRPFIFPEEIVVSEEGFTRSTLCIPCSPLKAPAGSGFAKWLVDEARKENWKTMDYCAIGPNLVTRAARNFCLHYYPWITFNPIPVGQFLRYLDPAGFEFSKDTYAAHMHHNNWVINNGLDPGAEYPFGCVYEWLKRRYRIINGPGYLGATRPTKFNPVTDCQLGAVVLRDGKRIQLNSKGVPIE